MPAAMAFLPLHTLAWQSGSEGFEGDEPKEQEVAAKKAAAALCVGVGSFSDPWELQVACGGMDGKKG